MKGICWRILLIVFVSSASVQAWAEPVNEARALLNEGKPKAAYELLKPLRQDKQGQPAFDFVYGMAALQSGHRAEASFAFERILFSQPNNQRVRLELARAYFELGNHVSAKRHFQHVLDTDPPPNVKRNIRRFLAKMERQQTHQRKRLAGRVDLRVGWDSNIRSATDLNFVDIGGFQFELADSSRETEDGFYQTIAKFKFTHQLGPRSGYFASLKADAKENINKHYDTLAGVVSAGPIFQLDKRNRIRIPVVHETFYLDDERFRSITGAAVEWSHKQSLSKYNVFLNANAIRYADQPTRDVDLALIGFANMRKPAEESQFKWFYSLFAGKEFAKQDGVDHLARTFVGGKLGAELQSHPDHTWYARLTSQRAEYNGTDPLFGEVREDTFAKLALGWNWQFTERWSAYLQTDFTDNASNIDLNEYDRTQVYAGVRWQY